VGRKKRGQGRDGEGGRGGEVEVRRTEQIPIRALSATVTAVGGTGGARVAR